MDGFSFLSSCGGTIAFFRFLARLLLLAFPRTLLKLPATFPRADPTLLTLLNFPLLR
jgi:hypothetical protein